MVLAPRTRRPARFPRKFVMRLHRLLVQVDDAAGIIEQDQTGGGREDFPGMAVEELLTEGLFQQTDVLTDRRLRQQHRCRRP